MGCGVAEATGLGCLFCCYQPSLFCQLSELIWGFFFLLHKFSNFIPPPPQTYQGLPVADDIAFIVEAHNDLKKNVRF